MGNIVELKKLVKNTLNNYCTDLYTGTRPGINPTQFFDDGDGINLSRKNSFPKGFLREGPIGTIKDNVGKTGYVRHEATVVVFYLAAESQTYDTGSGYNVSNEELCQYMSKEIKDTLLNNRFPGYALSPSSFGDLSSADKIKSGNFYVYQTALPISFYWYETYGV